MKKNIGKELDVVLVVGAVEISCETNWGIQGNSPIYPAHTSISYQGGELTEKGEPVTRKNGYIITKDWTQVWKGGRWLYVRKQIRRVNQNNTDQRTIFVRTKADFEAVCKWAKQIISFEEGIGLSSYGESKVDFVLWDKVELGVNISEATFFYKNGRKEKIQSRFRYNGTVEDLKKSQPGTIGWYDITNNKHRNGQIENFSVIVNGEDLLRVRPQKHR
ncbi:MAG: hypothetical protein G01um101418_881 [Parcubacteria group bacterium Gr01-1014_18]|nr:MAG: hypothetical protein Greene041636_920 [Parcubacteria group bacterium Greene0416_36]TSC79777.1 MAG: hypothetical protein G01um101418_881 [Parcubacteria group bacterium Gr01-1014_18]TSC98061.1 MAG: hypothetical protein Greene101420_890 [Parcubacteria group bacterium Greene1014_20]TSD06497.1 MAG: hypothetical protein Greene07142_840 [Parcubacteria group bacterium Greene0714_2]